LLSFPRKRESSLGVFLRILFHVRWIRAFRLRASAAARQVAGMTVYKCPEKVVSQNRTRSKQQHLVMPEGDAMCGIKTAQNVFKITLPAETYFCYKKFIKVF